LEGNINLYNKRGSFDTVQANTAAIIPRQFGYLTDVSGRTNMMGYVSLISGVLTTTVDGAYNTVTFSSVTDVIGGKSPIPGKPVRDALIYLNPGRFIVEVPGGTDLGIATAVIIIPNGTSCPTGTRP